MIRLVAWLLLFLAVALSAALPPSPVVAQQVPATQQQPDYAEWEAVASRAEDVVQAGRASNNALEELRSEIADWRARFLAAQGTNAARIKTLREQIAALGPAPAEGKTEAQELADRRSELNRQLSELQAPGLRAVEAHSLADGLINEIDKVIRERQAQELLELGPSPLNPMNWRDAAAALNKTIWDFGNEVGGAWANDTARAEMRNGLPATLLFLFLAVVLLARGRHWIERLTVWMVANRSDSRRTVYSALVSFGQVVLPFAGVFLLTAALQSSALLGVRTERVVQLLPVLGLTFLIARWLGSRVFAERTVSRPIFNLSPDLQASGRRYATLLGVVVALAILVESSADFNSFGPPAMAVVSFPALLLAGLMLSRMGQILLKHSVPQGGDELEEKPYRNRAIHIVGRVAIAVGLIGPLLAAIGYTKAADALVFPAVTSLALLGFVLILQRFVTDLYDLVTFGDKAAEDEPRGEALVPVLIGLALGLLALPVLALIWGARTADLSELWTRFMGGFDIGGTTISPRSFLTFALIFALGYTFTRVIQGTLRTTVLPKTKIDPGGQQALLSGLGYIGVFLAAIIAVTTAGIDLSSLAIVAGALSVGIGFGLQTIVSNFVSGIILLVERPISQGDWIEVGGTMGVVQDISVRATRIQTFDRTDVIVPNSDLISSAVTNWTRQNLTGRLIVKVGVAYGSDTRKVERILREIGDAHPLAMVNPPPTVVFQGFGSDALEFDLRVILRDVNYILSVQTELNHEIARRFEEEGIAIPFAQRDIWLRNPESLFAKPAAEREKPTPQHETRGQDARQYLTRDDLHADLGDGEGGGDGDGGVR